MCEVIVSVIMGVYNSDKNRLGKAIDSILGQTYDNFEFIICDDGSTNGVSEYISECYKDSRIRLISNTKNSGLAFTLNHCLKYAKGKYIARMDDDDISEKTRLKKQVKFLDENPQISIVGTSLWLTDENGTWGEDYLKETPCKSDLLYGVVHAHPSIMVRKEAYEAVDGYRSLKRTRRTEDYDLYLRMYALGIQGYNLQEKLYYYNQSMETLGKRKFNHRLDEVALRIEGFSRLGLMPKGIVYCFKPILSGIIPNSIKQKRLYKQHRIKE